MYCYHCGYKLNEHKLEQQKSSYALAEDQIIDGETQINYVCPRCGHLVHEGMSHEDAKELSRASHSQIQRGSNSYAAGMCMNILGVIMLIVSIIFFLLSDKPTAAPGDRYKCGEWKVFIGALIIAVILLTYGITKTVLGIMKKRHYTKLLKDLNNKTFAQ